MKHARTSIVNFLSELVMSISGFVATIVLTRTLGQSQYGVYLVVLSVLAWAGIVAELGLPEAIRKRVSEQTQGNYVISGAISQASLYVVTVAILWILRPFLNSYMGIEATWVLIAMLAAWLGLSFVRTVLDGQHLVHVSSILSPVNTTSRSIAQIVLVLSGLGILGAFTGYIVGAVVAIAVGAYFISIPDRTPSRQDFARLKSYAQFSWLNSIKGQTFRSMDTIILAVFVSNSLIAVYGVAWNLATLFAIFGTSISRTLFPEMSQISSADEDNERISELLHVSLAYSGLFIVPGLVGSALVGDVVLSIYGQGFHTGYYILLILTFAQLLYGYMRQFVSTLSATDRPNLSFRINSSFVVTNLGLNGILISQYGWYGAAAATTISAGLGLTLGYHYVNTIIRFTVPWGEILKQWLSATIMALVVVTGRVLAGSSLPVILALIGTGVLVYFSVLFVLSPEFRTTVKSNLPIALPTFGA